MLLLADLTYEIGRNLHPAAVHFPVALLVAAVAAEIWCAVKGPRWRPAVAFCLWGAAAGALLAATTGWFWIGDSMTDFERSLTWHQWLGTLLAVVAMALPWLESKQDASQTWRVVYLAGLALAFLLMVIVADLGGQMSHGIGFLPTGME